MRDKGLTLIELLIVFSIMGILLGVSLAAYNDFNQRQTLKGTALNLKNDLRAAQNQALAGEKPATGCLVLDGYEVRFPNSTSYEVRAKCSGPTYGNSTNYSLAKNVSFSPLPTPLLFKVLGQGVTSPQTVCLTGFGKIYKVEVTLTGEIKDEGVVASCP